MFRYSDAVECQRQISHSLSSQRNELIGFPKDCHRHQLRPNLGSAWLFTKLSIALATPRLRLLAIHSAQFLLFFPLEQPLYFGSSLDGLPAQYLQVSLFRFCCASWNFSAGTSNSVFTELVLFNWIYASALSENRGHHV